MASEIRVDKINSLSGVGTVTLSPTGVDIAGITTVATFKVGTGVTASSDGDIFATGITTVNSQVHIPDYIHHVGDNDCKFGFESGDTFAVETGGSERLRIDSSGRVLIGSTTADDAAQMLKVARTSGTSRLAIQAANDGSSQLDFADVADADIGRIQYDHNSNYMALFTNNSEALRIDSSGRLLLGTTTEGHDDADEITISGTRTGITIRSADDNYGNIFFSDATSGTDEYVGAVQYYHADNSLRLKTSSTDRLKILSSGYVNILTGGLTCTDDGAGSGTSNLELQPYGTDGYINCTASGNLYTRMGTGYTIRTRIDSSGNFHINSGNIVMSTSGKGIDFSATGDSSGTTSSEVFDDYEEGTFTPTITSGATSITYTIARGSYTKIGDVVYFQIDLYISGTADGNGLRIGGLPYTTANQATKAFGGAFLNYSAAAFSSIGDRTIFHIPSQNTFIQVYNAVTGNVVAGNSTGVDLFNNKEICLTGLYQAS